MGGTHSRDPPCAALADSPHNARRRRLICIQPAELLLFLGPSPGGQLGLGGASLARLSAEACAGDAASAQPQPPSLDVCSPARPTLIFQCLAACLLNYDLINFKL